MNTPRDEPDDAYRTYKMSDAIDQPLTGETTPLGDTPVVIPSTTGEQIREMQEAEEAKNAEASTRERMIKIGRGNQQAGRQGQ